MADEYIRLDTTIIGIDSLINKASTAQEAKVLFAVKDIIYNQQIFTDVQPVNQRIKEAKRLLKAAVEDIYQDKCDTCTQEIDCKFCYCEGLYKWRYVDEVLTLIGEDLTNSK